MSGTSAFDKVYAASETPYYGVVPSGLLKLCLDGERLHQGKALDIGCGDGRNACYLASLGYDVTAFDPSRPAIEKLSAFAARVGLVVDASVADMMTYDYGANVYRVIVASNVLGHADLTAAPALVGRWKESLAPGGWLYASAFTTDDPACRGASTSETIGFVETFYEPATFRQLFDGLELIRFGTEEFLDTGHGAPHTHCVVRVVGQKPAP